MDLGAALLALLTGVIVKLAVMSVTAWLLVRIYQSSYRPEQTKKLWLLLPKESLPEVRLLWWSLVLFAVSELTCGIEIYVLLRSNVVISSVHSITSASGMGLFALGFYLHFDKRSFGYGTAKCFLRKACRGCPVAQDPPEQCKLRVLLLLVGTFVALCALVPLLVSTSRIYGDVSRYTLPFETLNRLWDQSFVPWVQSWMASYEPSGKAFYLPEAMLFVEFRVIPVATLLITLWAIQRARAGDVRTSAKGLVFSIGAQAYVYSELVLYRATNEAIIGSLAHEVMELWFLIFVAELLRRTFGNKASAAPAEETA